MKEEEIRKKYQREDSSDPRGQNVQAMNSFIKMLNLHRESEDANIRNIAENFEHIDKVAPNFTIFQGKDCFFMHNFKAYQIEENTNMLIASHEFGHAVLSIMNNTKVPDDYAEVINRAKQHAMKPENKENFKAYIEYISGKTDAASDRTDAEKGPLSDMISSIFQQPGLRINSFENLCILPSSHSRDYYYDSEKNEMKIDKIFDEDFANYYALKANNCMREIETLKSLFGNELIEILDTELEKATNKLMQVRDNSNTEKPKDPMEQIKGVISAERESEIGKINSPEKIAEINLKASTKESEGMRNE